MMLCIQILQMIIGFNELQKDKNVIILLIEDHSKMMNWIVLTHILL